MTSETAEKIEDAAFEMSLDDVEVMDDYSGRGMEDRTTHAVHGSIDEVYASVGAAGLNPKSFRRDSLGLGIVIY